MKLLRITSPNPAWWNQVYSRRPGLDALSYGEQKQALDYDSYVQSDSYTYYLAKLGYECEQISSNITHLQKAWARENDVSWTPNGFQQSITLAHAISFKPEILFLNDTVSFDGRWINELKSKCETLRFVVGWSASPSRDSSALSCYDLVLSSSYPMVEEFRRLGLRAELLHHAFDPRILSRMSAVTVPTIDVSFVGALMMIKSFHPERAELLEALSKSIHLEVYTAEGSRGRLGRLRANAKACAYWGVENLRHLGVNERIIKRIPGIGKASAWTTPPRRLHLDGVLRPPVYGLSMYDVLARSKVTLNMHAGFASSWTGNMRLFEATGVGTCLVTDWKENISELFGPETEVVTYRSVHECIERVQWLLSNPGLRSDIASAGQRRTLRDHTYANRAEQLDSLLRSQFTRS